MLIMIEAFNDRHNSLTFKQTTKIHVKVIANGNRIVDSIFHSCIMVVQLKAIISIYIT